MIEKLAKNAVTRLWRRRRARFTPPKRGRSFVVEGLERRELLAADLALSSLTSDGLDLVVGYNVHNQNAAPFDIGIYESVDGVSADTLLQTERVTSSSDYAQGTGHTFKISPDFVDLSSDYYLVARLDISQEISESNENNNQQIFDGGVFLSDSDVVHVHGDDSYDSVSISRNSGNLDVTLNGVTKSFSTSSVSAVHVRVHDGNDLVTAVSAGSTSVEAYGGEGDDTITGGSGADVMYGGPGDDVMLGRSGADVLDGGSGDDEIGGGYGNDSIYGDDGLDMLHGDWGQDHIEGGADSDVIYGGDDADDIYAGSGDDYVFVTSADTVDLGPGSDTEYEDEDGGGYGAAYGNRPVISGFDVVWNGTDMWTISGSVSDDDDPTGWTITIGGVLDESVTVAFDDTFTHSVNVDEGSFGWVSAQVTDPDGNTSEIVWVVM